MSKKVLATDKKKYFSNERTYINWYNVVFGLLDSDKKTHVQIPNQTWSSLDTQPPMVLLQELNNEWYNIHHFELIKS